MSLASKSLILLLAVSSALCGQIRYPNAYRGAQVDYLHGYEITDPYRWMEDNDSAMTKEWVQAERACTNNYLKQLPGRDILRERLRKLSRYTSQSIPEEVNDSYYWFVKTPDANHAILCRSQTLFKGPEVVLDPNLFSKDGTVSLRDHQISHDGRYLAYAVSDGGSDWVTWKVRDLTTLIDLPDQVRWSKFSSAAWAPHSKGFFYCAYDAPTGDSLTDSNSNQKVYYHDTGLQFDALLLERPDQPNWGFSPATFDDRVLVITVSDGCSEENAIYYKDWTLGHTSLMPLVDTFDASYSVVAVEGDYFYIHTTNNAPMGRLVRIDIKDPSPENWVQVIPESDDKLETVVRVNKEYWVAEYLRDMHSFIHVVDNTFMLARKVVFKSRGCIDAMYGSEKQPTIYFAFSNPTTPPSVYGFDVQTGASELLYRADVDFDVEKYITLQTFYFSKDGTKIPVFISHARDTKLDGTNPTILYGYGGFNISVPPTFSWGVLSWLEMGGVFVTANIRGGGEYGEEWHKGGMLANKQNVFDDFIAAAEYLIASKVTRAKKLAIMGGSNGGLLVGACMNQRPDLFGACIPEVGVMDMLRFHKFTIGHAWTSDYGSPDDPKDFEVLRAYSPYHNLTYGVNYPATMVVTADHDDRVVPAHSFKYAAQLQYCQAGKAPVLIRIGERSGHGAGTSKEKRIEEFADKWAFLIANLGAEEMLVQPRSTRTGCCCH